MDSWVGTKNLVFCSAVVTMWLHFFSKSTKEVFSMQGVWHSPNMLPTMVHGQYYSHRERVNQSLKYGSGLKHIIYLENIWCLITCIKVVLFYEYYSVCFNTLVCWQIFYLVRATVVTSFVCRNIIDFDFLISDAEIDMLINKITQRFTQNFLTKEIGCCFWHEHKSINTICPPN
jgi:hypothetical protein